MIVKSAISTASDSDAAAAELAEAVQGFEPDLAALWVSPHHGPDYAVLANGIHELVSPRNLLGCSGESIIGPSREIEGSPATPIGRACPITATVAMPRIARIAHREPSISVAAMVAMRLGTLIVTALLFYRMAVGELDGSLLADGHRYKRWQNGGNFMYNPVHPGTTKTGLYTP